MYLLSPARLWCRGSLKTLVNLASFCQNDVSEDNIPMLTVRGDAKVHRPRT
jgi:hypothetical protein